jgi:ankyrin repeat protein
MTKDMQIKRDINLYLIDEVIEGNVETIQALLKKGAYVNARIDNSGQTALMLAIVKCHIAVVKVLLDSGANVNTKDKDGLTASMWATGMDLTEIVDLIKQRGTTE